MNDSSLLSRNLKIEKCHSDELFKYIISENYHIINHDKSEKNEKTTVHLPGYCLMSNKEGVILCFMRFNFEHLFKLMCYRKQPDVLKQYTKKMSIMEFVIHKNQCASWMLDMMIERMVKDVVSFGGKTIIVSDEIMKIIRDKCNIKPEQIGMKLVDGQKNKNKSSSTTTAKIGWPRYYLADRYGNNFWIRFKGEYLRDDINGTKNDFTDPPIIYKPPPSIMNNIPAIEMKFTVMYENGLAESNIEREPRLHIYLSNTLSRNVKNIDLYAKDEIRGYRKVNYIMNDVVFRAECIQNRIPYRACMNFEVFSDVYASGEGWCGNQAGECSLRMTEIMSNLRNHGKFEKRIPLMVPTAVENKNKGYLTIKFVRGDSISGRNGMKLEFEEPDLELEDIMSDENKVNKLIQEEIKRVYQTHKEMKPSVSGIDRIHAYKYDIMKGSLPAYMFHFIYTSSTNESFYLNLANIVLRRYYMKEKDLMESNDDDLIGRITLEMMTVYANWCKYITDLIFAPGSRRLGLEEITESFDILRSRGIRSNPWQRLRDPTDASDCEDFSREILMQLLELQKGTWKSPLLRKLQDNCKYWLNFAVLAGVSGAKLAEHVDTAEMGGHEYVIRLPKKHFFDMLRHWNPRHLLLSLVSPGEQELGANLKLQVGEGTGLMYCKVREDNTDSVRKFMEKKLNSPYRSVLFDSHHMRQCYSINEGKESTFYKTVSTGWCPELMERFNMMEFTLHYPFGYDNAKVIASSVINSNDTQKLRESDFIGAKGENNIVDKKRLSKYGVLFSHLTLDANPETRRKLGGSLMAISPQEPLINPLLVKVIREIKNDEYPSIPLHAPSPEVIKEYNEHPIMNIRQPFRLPISHKVKMGEEVEDSDYFYLVYFLKYNHATPEIVKAIEKICQSHGIGLFVSPEVVTAHGLGGFYIRMQVPKNIQQIR